VELPLGGTLPTLLLVNDDAKAISLESPERAPSCGSWCSARLSQAPQLGANADAPADPSALRRGALSSTHLPVLHARAQRRRRRLRPRVRRLVATAERVQQRLGHRLAQQVLPPQQNHAHLWYGGVRVGAQGWG
jgi:hypothetical protein